jgi:8-oxo-dGTP diphosphatase
MKPDEMFYVVQKAIVRKGGEILVLNDPVEGLDYPGGKIQEGEANLVDALKREVFEETGLEINVGESFATDIEVFSAGHRLFGHRAFIVWYNCEYISGDVVLSDEHNKSTWVNKDNYRTVDDGTSYFDILEKCFQK